MKNKLFLATLASAITIPAMVAPIQAEAAVQSPFKDIAKTSPYYDIIHDMRDKGIISGYENGTFRPNESISRKHAAALVGRAKELKSTVPFVQFKDVSTTNPYFNDIKKLQQAGIFKADAKGNLNPNQPITRAEMAKILTVSFDLEVKDAKDFPDVPKNHPAYNDVKALYSNGVTTGDDGLFKPNAPLTRAHYAVFMHRAMNLPEGLKLEDLDSMSKSEILALTDKEIAKLILPYNTKKPVLPNGVTDAQKHSAENLKKFNEISVQFGANLFLKKTMVKGMEFNVTDFIVGWSENVLYSSPKEVIELINKVYSDGIVISSLDMKTRKPLVMFYDYAEEKLVFSFNNSKSE